MSTLVDSMEDEEPMWAKRLFGKLEEMQTQLINKYNKLEERMENTRRQHGTARREGYITWAE
eukprot:12247034-Prorocentrum_lima.AAC.1